MPTVELNDSEMVLVELAEERYQTLMQEAQQVVERAEAIRASAYAAIVRRAIKDGQFATARGIKGPPEIVRNDEQVPVRLVWAVAAQKTPAQVDGAALPT